jgi:hypothetical protein
MRAGAKVVGIAPGSNLNGDAATNPRIGDVFKKAQ